MLRIIALLTILSLVSCSSGKTGEEPAVGPGKTESVQVKGTPESSGSAAVYSVEIVSGEVTRKAVLNLFSRNFDLANATIEWLVNGVRVPDAAGKKFDVVSQKKGDTVQARVFYQGQEILSNVVTLKNAPPEMKRIKIMPEVFKPGDLLYVEAEAEDADGDDVTIAYEWSKNGEPAGTGKQIEAPVKRGDKITIKLTAFDGENYNAPVTMTREIRNMPPAIVEDKKFSVKGGLYSYQVKATDPDGDTLVYTIKSAPRGMTIDQGTGMIRWNMPVDFKGKTAFTVSVSDGNGGEAKQDFVFEIRPEAGK